MSWVCHVELHLAMTVPSKGQFCLKTRILLEFWLFLGIICSEQMDCSLFIVRSSLSTDLRLQTFEINPKH